MEGNYKVLERETECDFPPDRATLPECFLAFDILRKTVLTEVLLFCANAPDNFLERELDMKRGMGGGLHFPIYFHPWLLN